MPKEMDIYGDNTLSAFEYITNKDVGYNTDYDPLKHKFGILPFTDYSKSKPVDRIKIEFRKSDEEGKVIALEADDEAYSFVIKQAEKYAGNKLTDTEAANLLGLTAAEIANIRNKNRKLNAKMILRIFLLADEIPDIKDINHTLMTMELTGLYLSTYSKEVNIRNSVLTSAFEFLALPENKNIAGITRIKLINRLFEQNNMAVYFSQDMYSFTQQELENADIEKLCVRLYDYSQKLISQVKEAQFEKVRHTILEKYANKKGVTVEAANLKIRRSFENKMYSSSVQNHLFNYDPKNIGSREVVITLGLLLECNFCDMTRLLIEANHPMLYWNREKDRDVIREIYKNP